MCVCVCVYIYIYIYIYIRCEIYFIVFCVTSQCTLGIYSFHLQGSIPLYARCNDPAYHRVTDNNLGFTPKG